MIQMYEEQYSKFIWSPDKNDFAEVTNIFNYKWNFSNSYIPGQTFKRLNIPKCKNNDVLYILDDNDYDVKYDKINDEIGKVYYIKIFFNTSKKN